MCLTFRLGAVFALLPPTIQPIDYGVKNLCKVFLTIFVIVVTNRLEYKTTLKQGQIKILQIKSVPFNLTKSCKPPLPDLCRGQ
jgi:hypothetical protein